MSDSVINQYETSVENGNPVELYMFTHVGVQYLYTSADVDITYIDGNNTYLFKSEYIKRGGDLKVGGSDSETCTINVKRTNSIAMLFQGSPPESPTDITIYRMHTNDSTKADVIMVGNISQCSLDGSEATLNATMESYMGKEIPRGKLQYYCNNTLFDANCGLDEELYTDVCKLDIGYTSLSVSSTDIGKKEDGYYTGGVIIMGDSIRQVLSHTGTTVTIKYPFPKSVITGSFTISAGCDALFTSCATKFNNTSEFTGVPYTEPTDSIKNPTGHGTYWISTGYIKRDTEGVTGKITL